MLLFERIKKVFTDFFLRSSDRQDLEIKDILASQKKQRQQLADTLTELIFRRKQLETQIESCDAKIQQWEKDLEQVALQDKDELAIQIMSELELAKKDQVFLRESFEQICEEILSARQMERELGQQMQSSKAKLSILASKGQALRLREQLMSQSELLKNQFHALEPSYSLIDEKIQKMDARLEQMQGSQKPFENELNSLRKQRHTSEQRAKLATYKKNLQSRMLPGQSIQPEILFSHTVKGS